MAHVGSCFCGAVELEVAGAPEAMGYCHCSSCRSWSGGPVNAFSLWKPEAVRDHVGRRARRDVPEDPVQPAAILREMRRAPDDQPSDRWAWWTCSPRRIPTLTFAPGVHVNYAETVLPMRDGLPKLKDFPAEFGGSGEAIAE